MNRDMSIISRALAAAGQEPLTAENVRNDDAIWRAIKTVYLPVLLSVISSAEWTELKRRKALVQVDGAENTARRYAYALPDDCARAIELSGSEEYEIEGRTLYCDTEGAVLLYVTDGKRRLWWKKREEVSGEAFHRGMHYTLLQGGTSGIRVRWQEDGDDYPEYDLPAFSPELSECFAMSLAAELVLKITGDKQLYGMFVQLADAARRNAAKTSRAKTANRTQGTAFWGDRLGISSRGF